MNEDLIENHEDETPWEFLERGGFLPNLTAERAARLESMAGIRAGIRCLSDEEFDTFNRSLMGIHDDDLKQGDDK